MSALPIDLTARVAKLLPRLASDQNGEVAATAAAIQRTLKAAGHDLHDLADHVAAPRETGRLEPPSYPFGTWRRAAGDPASTFAQRAQVDHLQNIGGHVLTRWEAEFLESLHDQLVRGRRLSERQVATLAKIDVKVRRRPTC